MKRVLYIIVALGLMAFGLEDGSSRHAVVYIASGSSLKIGGTTNINTFTCEFNTSKMMAPIPVHYKRNGSDYIFHQADLILDNQGFDCGSRGINRDFHDLLRSKEYPSIRLRLKEVQVDAALSALMAKVDIEIAGYTNSYDVPIQYDQKDHMHVLGELKLSLDDFNLKAPKKVLGLITVHETITINFDLILRKE